MQIRLPLQHEDEDNNIIDMYSGERKLIRPGIHPLQALPRRRYRRRAGIYAHGRVFHSEGCRREMPQLVGAAAIQVGRLLHPLLWLIEPLLPYLFYA